jgi:hypothetical protein
MARDFPGSGAGTRLALASGGTSLDFNGVYGTWSAWVNVDSIAAGAKAVAVKRDQAAADFQYDLSIDGSSPRAFVGNGGSTFDNVTSAIPITTGLWYHLCAVKEGTGANALRIYVNGVLGGAVTSNVSIGSSAQPFTLGRSCNADQEFLDGRISNVAVWASALSPAEIEQLYKGLSPLLIKRDLRGYWTLNDYGVSGGAFDQSYFNNTLAQTGTIPLAPHFLPQIFDAINPTELKRPGSIPRIAPAYYGGRNFPIGGRSFDGSASNYLNVGDVSALDITGTELTISAWIRASDSGTRIICGKRQNSASSIQYYLVQDGLQLGAGIGDGAAEDQVFGGSLQVSRWHHVAFHKTSASMELWIDGVLVAKQASTKSIANTAASFRIGDDDGGTFWTAFNGAIADVAVWNINLSQGEIERLALGYSPIEVKWAYLRGYWPLWDYNASGMARDYSIYQNNATMVGTVGTFSPGSMPVQTPPASGWQEAIGESQLGPILLYQQEVVSP